MHIAISFFLFIYATSGFCTAPLAIIEDWQRCQTKSELDQGCIKIGHKALQLKNMVELLESNPQGFGIDIMHLQQQIEDPNISLADKKKIQQELDLRISIVGWLESPK